MRVRIMYLILITVLIAFTACNNLNRDIIKNENKEDVIKEEKIKNDFKWKTIKDIEILINSTYDNVVYIKSDNGDIYLKAFIKAGQQFESKITIPAYVEKVIVHCKDKHWEFLIAKEKVNCVID